MRHRIAIALLAASMFPVVGSGTAASATPPSSVKPETAEFRAAMRSLWNDHVVWTRQWIVSFAAGLPDQEAAAARLMRNQEDIGDAIKPFYGEAAGAKLTGVKAAKANDTAAIASAKTAWFRNGDEISAFLSAANPKNWPLADMQAAMRMHLDTTLTEATDRLAGNWAQDVKNYDKVQMHIQEMADTLSDGIVKQHPQSFRGPAAAG
jgi:hypothetical protein